MLLRKTILEMTKPLHSEQGTESRGSARGKGVNLQKSFIIELLAYKPKIKMGQGQKQSWQLLNTMLRR